MASPSRLLLAALLAVACSEAPPRATDASAPDGSAPPDGGAAAFSFLVLGDNQPPGDDCDSPLATPELRAVPLAARSLNPGFVLHLGDMVDMGRVPGAFDQFERCFAPLLEAAPLFPTVGNHELDWGLGAVSYRRYLARQLLRTNPEAGGPGFGQAFPATFERDSARHPDRAQALLLAADTAPSGLTYGTYYAFEHRNAFFVSMEVATRWDINTPRQWLEEQLARARATPGIRHIFVFMHSPVYSTFKAEIGGDSLRPARLAYESLFRKYDVTMVFSGHAHTYDRFLVPDDGMPSQVSPPPTQYRHDGKAVHYLVIGPAGGNYLPGGCAPTPPPRQELSYNYLQARKCGQNMARVSVSGDMLEVQVLGLEGGVGGYRLTEWDRFTLK